MIDPAIVEGLADLLGVDAITATREAGGWVVRVRHRGGGLEARGATLVAALVDALGRLRGTS